MFPRRRGYEPLVAHTLSNSMCQFGEFGFTGAVTTSSLASLCTDDQFMFQLPCQLPFVFRRKLALGGLSLAHVKCSLLTNGKICK